MYYFRIRTYMDELRAMICGLKDSRRSRWVFCKPDYLPFLTVAHFKKFQKSYWRTISFSREY